MDKKLLEGILVFLRSCSFFLFAIGIGLFIYSFKTDDGARKTDALKVMGIGIFLFGLKIVAEVSGLI